MRKLFLGPDSPLWPAAIDLEMDGRCETHLIRPDATELPASPVDQVLIGTSVDLWFVRPLLMMAAEGHLGDVRVVLDHGHEDLGRLGWRARPWLRAIHELVSDAPKRRGRPPKGAPPPPPPLPAILPAPRVASRSLEEIFEQWTPPRVRFAPIPSRFPARLQLQTTTACRAACPWCPHPGPDAPVHRMDEGLYRRILAQCAVGKPDVIELYFHAESLLDERLEAFAADARAAVPEALVTTVVHENALDEGRALTLAAVMPVIFVSLNAPGQSAASLKPRIERLARLAAPFKRAGGQLILTTLENLLPSGTRTALRKLAKAHELPLESFRATTRTGGVDLAPYLRPGATHPGQGALCERPFTTAYVRASGELVLCCEDWTYSRSMGSAEDIAGAWVGPAYQRVRQELLDGAPSSPCDRCDLLLGQPPAP
ncbi:MAG: SPASM domain-containing protein [Deltaproteobacteria bacterium]|nr:SPASM domain-containing protein [Deltaproteobacteria bacterium]